MTYPTTLDVTTYAQQSGAPQLLAFAFAADYGRLPYTVDELQGFRRNVEALANVWGYPDKAELIYGFLQSRGRLPGVPDEINWWIHEQGYATADGWTGKAPYGGLDYPPRGTPTPVTVPSTPRPVVPVPSGGVGFKLDVGDWIADHSLLAGGVAIVGYLWLFGVPRFLRKRRR
ncbi:MAG: hypothetical protein EPO21_13130 [Chloroflexota bacterium]|nr:MAG: hypothetical protein EPO21_13130 [Chloroflexota bacterium]